MRHQQIIIDGPTDDYGRTPHTRLWCEDYPAPGHPFPENSRCPECGGYRRGQCFNAPLPEEKPMHKFMWNGIKVAGKLHRAWYSRTKLVGYDEGTITIYARDYWPGLPQIEGLTIHNGTEIQTDYFEHDHVRVSPDNPHYADVLAAYEKQKAHNAKRYAKRVA